MGLITITERWTDATFSSERLVGDAGSVALTCCAGREADKQQGRAEDLPQSLAVAPGKAKAAIVFARGVLFRKAAEHDERGSYLYETGRDTMGEMEEEVAALCRKHAETLWSLLPEPDSEAPEERSGRRNAKCAGTDASEKTL